MLHLYAIMVYLSKTEMGRAITMKKMCEGNTMGEK
jgi:hypothetical protein